jgi:hypothetical protein
MIEVVSTTIEMPSRKQPFG